jgi:ABC-type multidrug transport system fused ATPase/permease subunit
LKEQTKTRPDLRSLARVVPTMVAGHWHYVAVLFVMILFTSILEGIGFSLVIPVLQSLMSPTEQAMGGGALQDAVTAATSWMPADWRLPGLLALLSVVFLIKSFGLIASSALMRWFVDTLRINWVSRVFLAFTRAPYAEVASRPHGEVVQNILGESDIGSRTILLLIEFAARSIQMVVLVTLLLLTNWRATLLVLALGVLLVALSWRATGRFSVHTGRTRQAIRRQASDIVSECITGLRTVKLLDIGAPRAKKLRAMLRDYRGLDTKLELISGLPSNTIDLMGVVVGSAIILFMTQGLGLRIEEVLPTTALFGLVFLRLAGSAGFLFSRRLGITSSFPSLSSVYDMMMMEPEQVRGRDAFPGISGDIVFEDIVLQPPGRPTIFNGLSMAIPAVGLTAIVGPSGSGKTTLVDLIVRLREPDAGRVLIGGRDIRGFDVRSLRARVAYLSQEVQLFNGTVAENLLLGRPAATEVELIEAAKSAHAYDFIAAMPEHFNTPLGRGALTLSGGQRQRLALARELLRNPDLYIFDEPTSALDRDAEAVIGELVNELSKTHPVVIISHRPDVIFGAQVIYRIEDGKAVKASLPELEKAPLNIVSS